MLRNPAAVAVLLFAAEAHAQPNVGRPPAALFSSIVQDPLTGERDGLSVDIRAAGWAEVLICQGECRVAVSGPIRWERGEVAFHTIEPLIDVTGGRDFQIRTDFRGRVVGDDLEIVQIEPPIMPPQKLTRRRR